MWSELDSVVWTEPRGHLVDHCAVYNVHILWRRGFGVSAESRAMVDSADSSGNPGEAEPVRRSSGASSGERAG